MSIRSLPLGIDIGATRLRVAHVLDTASGPQLSAVAVRSLSPGASSSAEVSDAEYVAVLLEEAVAELKTKERRCVAALGGPGVILRPIALPKMTWIERERAARYEGERCAGFPIDEAAVRVHRTAVAGTWGLGIVHRKSLFSRTAALKSAGLKPIAVDHEACAFARAFPEFDAVVDMGHRRTAMHVFSTPLPVTLHAENGGAHVTNAIGRELAIDEHSAETRKRILGIAGAGERALNQFASEISGLIRSARATRPIVRVALVGNAARLPRLGHTIEAATGARCETPVAAILRTPRYPEDVIRSCAPDWTLACSLATWKRR